MPPARAKPRSTPIWRCTRDTLVGLCATQRRRLHLGTRCLTAWPTSGQPTFKIDFDALPEPEGREAEQAGLAATLPA